MRSCVLDRARSVCTIWTEVAEVDEVRGAGALVREAQKEERKVRVAGLKNLIMMLPGWRSCDKG